MIVVEQGSASPKAHQGLIDEQQYLSDQNYQPVSFWERCNGKIKLETELYFDLSELYELSQIGFYDGKGILDITFYIGEPGNWHSLPKTTDKYNVWNYIPLNETIKTRYLKIAVSQSSDQIGELKLIGKKMGETGNLLSPKLSLIPLHENQVTNLLGLYSENQSSAIVDEQPTTNEFPTNIPNTYFGVTYQGGIPEYQDTLDIDLKTTYELDYITCYVGNKKGTLNIYSGQLNQWNLEKKIEVWEENSWIRIKLDNINTRYLRIEKDPSLELFEVVSYGRQIGILTQDNGKGSIPKQLEMDKFMGMNGMFPTPIPVLIATTNLREYHNIYYNSDPKDNYLPYFPSYLGTNFDNLYSQYNKQKINTLATLQRATDYYGGVDKLPVTPGGDTEDPSSYREHAQLLFNFAARYGATTVDSSRLTLSKNATDFKTGLNLVHEFENWNEPDSKWKKKDEYFYAAEYAAMTSADYDGHESKLGENIGIKNADPKATFVMAGLAGINKDYIKAMNYWFKNNRDDQKFAADVINVHEYFGQKAPENTDFKKKLLDLVDYVETELPEKEIWLTEFGYDSYNGEYGRSKNSAPGKEAQAQWLIRAYLLAASTGINRAYMFQDVDPGIDNNQYAHNLFLTSGLVRHEKFDYERKQSYYYTYATKNILSNYTFDSVIQENQNMYIYKFKNQTGKTIYALWSPTENNTIINDYNFSFFHSTDSVTQIELQDLSTNGVRSTLNTKNESINLTIGETPLFIEVAENETVQPPTTNKIPGAYSESLSVELASESGSDTYYTLDGSEPTKDNSRYEKPIELSKNTIIKAVTYKNGNYSTVAEFPYQITLDKLTVKNRKVTYTQNNVIEEETFFKDIEASTSKKDWVILSNFDIVDFAIPGNYTVSVQSAYVESNGYVSANSSKIDIEVTIKGTLNCTVTFDTNGGSAIEALSVTEGDNIAKPNDPVRSGYSFTGWFKDKNLADAWNFSSDAVTESITLFAGWKKRISTSTTNKNEILSDQKKSILPKTNSSKEFIIIPLIGMVICLLTIKRFKQKRKK